MILKLSNKENTYTFTVDDLNNGEKLYYKFQIPASDVVDGKYNMVLMDDDGNIITEEQVCMGYFNAETIQYNRGENVYINSPLNANLEDVRTITIDVPNYTIYPSEGYDAMKEVVVDAQPVYDNGYNEGEIAQKAKLTGITITENGTYSREDGYNEVVVEVPDLNGDYNEGYDAGKVDGYNSGYTAGIEEGTANAGETIAQTARVLNITNNGTYTSEYSQWDDYPKPELVTGVFEDGKEFFNYTQYNGYYDTGIIPTKDTKLEFWIKDNLPTRYNNIVYIGVDGFAGNDFYFGKSYSRQKYIAAIGDGYLYFNQTDEWLHIIMSVADGLIVNGEKIGDFELSDLNISEPIYINGGASSIGMVKINDQIIIPTTDGLFNFTTNEYLSKPVSITDYIYTNNFTEPVAEGNLIRTVNVDVQPKTDVAKYGIKFGYSTFTTIPDFYVFEGITDVKNMFRECNSLQTIPLIDTSKVTYMYYMFGNCGSLQTIPLIDTSKVTNMNYMFGNCGSLQTIPLIDTSKVTNMNNMFFNCGSLQTIPELDTRNVTNMGYMFQMYNSNSQLISLPKIYCDSCTNIATYFQGARNYLTDVGGWINLKINWNDNYGLKSCPNLTYQSCINILNGLADVTELGSRTLKVHPNFLTTVGDEISIGTNKGWTITA